MRILELMHEAIASGVVTTKRYCEWKYAIEDRMSRY